MDIRRIFGVTILCAIVQKFVPGHLWVSLGWKYEKLLSFFSSQVSITFNEFLGKWDFPSEAYSDIAAYLGHISSSRASRFIGILSHRRTLVLGLEDYQEVVDEFQGVKVWWVLGKHANKNKSASVSYAGENIEKRYYKLTFHARHRNLITGHYLKYVLKQGREQNERIREKYLYTNEDDKWKRVVFEHPATFKTLALDVEKKKEIRDDLMAFGNSEAFFARIGRSWKRGYLLSGLPGTGKSSMIAAMANFLNYDVYHLELTGVKSNTQLKKLLMEISSKSILVIEDIDCSLDLTGQGMKTAMDENGTEDDDYGYKVQNPTTIKLPLSGFLNLIDGVWSSCSRERLIILTTNHVEDLDPGLISNSLVDKHIKMSYCTFEAFKTLAKNYLNIRSHPSFDGIRELLEQVNITPAEVTELLMPKTPAEDAEISLQNLVQHLEQANEITINPENF